MDDAIADVVAYQAPERRQQDGLVDQSSVVLLLSMQVERGACRDQLSRSAAAR